jgi:hypothetical protein
MEKPALALAIPVEPIHLFSDTSLPYERSVQGGSCHSLLGGPQCLSPYKRAPSLTSRLPAAAVLALALQLPFCFEVRALSGSLVSSAPRRPCDDVCGLNTVTSESDGNAADFLD